MIYLALRQIKYTTETVKLKIERKNKTSLLNTSESRALPTVIKISIQIIYHMLRCAGESF